jgi:2-dehydro-3-deoxygluconokinase
MSKVITMGETMAALVPQNSGPLRYVEDFKLRIAGAEGNIAIGLAKLGIDAFWISRLGEDELGHFVLNHTRAEGADCSGVIMDTCHRTGVMLKETSAGETKVYYYRENSAASHLCPGDIKEEYFVGADILMFTGITPVLSDDCRYSVDTAISYAKRNGMLLAFDPNIRKKLWGSTDYTELIRNYMMQSDIVMMGSDEAAAIFDSKDEEMVMDVLFDIGRASFVAIKKGDKGAVVADRSRRVEIKPFPCRCIEPVGAGDGFDAGFLTGIIWGRDVSTAGKMGAVAGALATETTGDVEGYPDIDRMKEILVGSSITYR